MNKIILENYSLPAVSSCDTLEDLLYVLGRECTSSLHTICVNQQEIGSKTDPLGVPQTRGYQNLVLTPPLF